MVLKQERLGEVSQQPPACYKEGKRHRDVLDGDCLGAWAEFLAVSTSFFYDLSPWWNSNVRCSGDRQVGPRKRFNMASYSGFKQYSKKGSGLTLIRKIKQTNQGLFFYLPDPLYLKPLWASWFFSQEIDRTETVTIWLPLFWQTSAHWAGFSSFRMSMKVSVSCLSPHSCGVFRTGSCSRELV